MKSRRSSMTSSRVGAASSRRRSFSRPERRATLPRLLLGALAPRRERRADLLALGVPLDAVRLRLVPLGVPVLRRVLPGDVLRAPPAHEHRVGDEVLAV